MLASHAPLSATQLAERTAMSKVDISRAVKELEGLGMVLRKSDRADRRRAFLRLSARGTATYGEVLPLAVAIEKKLLLGFTAPEIKLLKRAMSRVARNASLVLTEGSEP